MGHPYPAAVQHRSLDTELLFQRVEFFAQLSGPPIPGGRCGLRLSESAAAGWALMARHAPAHARAKAARGGTEHRVSVPASTGPVNNCAHCASRRPAWRASLTTNGPSSRVRRPSRIASTCSVSVNIAIRPARGRNSPGSAGPAEEALHTIATSCGDSFNVPNSVLQNRCWYFGTRLPNPERSRIRCFFAGRRACVEPSARRRPSSGRGCSSDCTRSPAHSATAGIDPAS